MTEEQSMEFFDLDEHPEIGEEWRKQIEEDRKKFVLELKIKRLKIEKKNLENELLKNQLESKKIMKKQLDMENDILREQVIEGFVGALKRGVSKEELVKIVAAENKKMVGIVDEAEKIFLMSLER